MGLKIAIFSDSYIPVLNGVSISIRDLVSELRNQGHSVHIFTARAPGGYRDSDPNVHRFLAMETPWTRQYPLVLPPVYPMIGTFRREHFDIIHTHTPFTVGFVGLRWGQSHGIPVVATYHTLYDKYAHYIPYFPKRYIRYKIAKHTNFYYNQVQHVITPSDASARWLVRHSVKSPITVIPTAPAPPEFMEKAVARHHLNLPINRTILLTVGRIALEKNVRTLLEAAALVFRSHPEAMLVLVGDGPYRAEAQRLASQLGIGDRVRFDGFVPREQVDAYYAAADLFLFASVTETQGLVVNEAMAYSLPAVVVNGGGAGASVLSGENGLLVSNDPAAIGQAVETILHDEALYAAMAKRAAQTGRGYGLAEMASRVLAIYEQVLRKDHVHQEAERSAPMPL